MSEVSIKVEIAGRTYPLTVSSQEETVIRQSEKLIQESISVFQQNYAVKDKQDLLAMAALQLTSRKQTEQEPKVIEKIVDRVVEVPVEVPVEVVTDLSNELLELEAKLDELLA